MQLPHVTASRRIADLPHALGDGHQFAGLLADRRPAVFLDYDGTLTSIVDRPEDAVISDSMRQTVRELARRATVCVVSGRDRPVVQKLMGIDDLVVAGSHGFDIWDPQVGTVHHDAATGFEDLVSRVTQRMRTEVEPVHGAVVEPKRASVAVHYRHVAEAERPLVKAVVDALLAEYPDQLKVTPGKMVYEVQPKVDWNKGKAVRYLLSTLNLDADDSHADDLHADDIVPLYLGDDITDEDAFQALAGWGIGIVVANLGDQQEANRLTAADFVLESISEVEQFLNALAH